MMTALVHYFLLGCSDSFLETFLLEILDFMVYLGGDWDATRTATL
jgi:hypothetical protein